MILVYSLLASLVVSCVALIGIVTLLFNEKTLHKILLVLVGFSAGGLMGSAFFHILPEAIQTHESTFVFASVIAGFSIFYLLERVIHWRHCHDDHCETHPFVYLNLIGDSMHNFVDGLIIVAAFITNYHLGIFTTFTIILHEIPHELGNFAILIHGGFSRWKALFFNFITALCAVLGVLVGFFFVKDTANTATILLAYAAGGFIYVAASDLIPELHKEKDFKKSMIYFFFFLCGIFVMWEFKVLFAGTM